jgi:hypothetical protein
MAELHTSLVVETQPVKEDFLLVLMDKALLHFAFAEPTDSTGMPQN